MAFLHLPLEVAPHVLNRVQVWRHTWPLHHLHLQQQGNCHLGGVFGVVVMLENSFWREVIIFCFRMSQFMLESMFPSTNCSSPVPAVVMQPQAMMLPPPCLTVGKAQFSWYSSVVSPHMLDTIWVKQVYLRHQTTGHGSSNSCYWPGCLQQSVCRFFCEPASEEASFWDDGHANWLVAVCGVWSEHWKADLPLLQPLKQCWQHSCVCFLKPASASDAQHKDSTSLIDPCKACSEWNPPRKTSVTQFQAVTELLIASDIFVESNNSNSQILREFFAMRCHVEHPVVSMRELYSKNQILTALKQDIQICMVLSSRQKHEHDE